MMSPMSAGTVRSLDERECERESVGEKAKRWRLSRAVGASRLARRVGMR